MIFWSLNIRTYFNLRNSNFYCETKILQVNCKNESKCFLKKPNISIWRNFPQSLHKIHIFLKYQFNKIYIEKVSISKLWAVENKRIVKLRPRLKNLPAMQETQIRSLSQEDLLEKEMPAGSSILAWRIPWTEEPDREKPMWLQRVRHDWVTFTFTTVKLKHKVRYKEKAPSEVPYLHLRRINNENRKRN